MERGHRFERERLGLAYSYAYTLELTKRYDEEAQLLTFIRRMMRRYEWGDTASIIYKTYRFKSARRLKKANTQLQQAYDQLEETTTAKEVGGDLYDAQLIDGCRLYFCVGDVSGNDSAMFVTMFIGLLELETGRLDFCNCGHNPPIIVDATPHFIEMETNAPIGIMPDMSFEGETIDDIRNKPLFIYTDGLNEAENPLRQQLGDERLLDYLCQKPFTTAKALIDGLTDLVNHHRDGAESNDDLTMLCLHFKTE